MYIMTLGVLAAYRNRGIGSKLVTSVLDYFELEKDGKLCNVDEIMLHVQTSNADAMKFYGDIFGFERGELVENYYKRIDPPHCYVLRKKLR
jgi:ribosomal protein S18 acetylase RimI-like enzyme